MYDTQAQLYLHYDSSGGSNDVIGKALAQQLAKRVQHLLHLNCPVWHPIALAQAYSRLASA